MQTSLSHEDEAQTNETVAAPNARDLVKDKIITVLAMLIDTTYAVCHAICDETSKVTTLEDAKEALQHLLNAIHQGSALLETAVTEFEISERANATGTSALN